MHSGIGSQLSPKAQGRDPLRDPLFVLSCWTCPMQVMTPAGGSVEVSARGISPRQEFQQQQWCRLAK